MVYEVSGVLRRIDVYEDGTSQVEIVEPEGKEFTSLSFPFYGGLDGSHLGKRVSFHECNDYDSVLWEQDREGAVRQVLSGDGFEFRARSNFQMRKEIFNNGRGEIVESFRLKI